MSLQNYTIMPLDTDHLEEICEDILLRFRIGKGCDIGRERILFSRGSEKLCDRGDKRIRGEIFFLHEKSGVCIRSALCVFVLMVICHIR